MNRVSKQRCRASVERCAFWAGCLVLVIAFARVARAVPGPEIGGTFSIVAADPKTGEVGVAVQSHWFSVGALVPWARGGVGAVATQSFVEVSYGPKLLERLARGEAPSAALAELVDADSSRDLRQVGVVDVKEGHASHTGRACIVYAGGTTGVTPDGMTYACQGNLLASDAVWPAMAEAFAAAAGEALAERLLRAIEAGQAAGGDARGVQSAALLVERPISELEPWKNRYVDLRVEDHVDPVGEIRRLYRVWSAYKLADEGDARLAALDHAGAYDKYDAALALLPENDELLFWRGSMGYRGGRPEQALTDVRRAIELNPRWTALLERIDESLFPGVSEVRAKLSIK